MASWRDRLGFGTRPIFGWTLYDWGNSAFYTIVVTAVYPIFFARYAAAGSPPGAATVHHANATTIALVAVALLSPLLGAAADTMGAKKMLLGIFLALGVVATAAMALVERGHWPFASACFVLANVGIVGSLVFYDSLLPHLVIRNVGAEDREEAMDRISSAGYALGYLGGGLALLLALVAVQKPALFGLADSFAAMKASFLLTAVWWGLFSIPLFRWVPEPPLAGPRIRLAELPSVTLRQLGTTFGHLKQYRQALLLLVAVAIYSDGIGTIVRMAATFGTDLGVSPAVLIGTVLAIQFVGIPFALLFGALGAKIGAKWAILVALVVYCAITVYAYFVRGTVGFVVLGLLVGTVQGGAQALSRSLFASFVPPQHSSEFFGFFSIFEKFAGILGPALFGIVVASTGSSRAAILGVVVFFVVGGALLLRVNVAEGRRAAQEPITPPAPEPALAGG